MSRNEKQFDLESPRIEVGFSSCHEEEGTFSNRASGAREQFLRIEHSTAGSPDEKSLKLVDDGFDKGFIPDDFLIFQISPNSAPPRAGIWSAGRLLV